MHFRILKVAYRCDYMNKLMKLGYNVKLIATQKVKAYMVDHKNGCRGYLAIHKIQQNYVRAGTDCIHVIRGLSNEFGYHANQGNAHVYKLVSDVLAAKSQIPGVLKQAIAIQKALQSNRLRIKR